MKLKMFLVIVASILLNFAFGMHDYLEYINQYPEALGPIGNYQKGEIEIVLEEGKIQEIEKATRRKVGVIAEDQYWIWINDAVRFPNGKYGVYGRIIWRNSLEGVVGVAVLPILPNGKIALNRNFRHAIRSWEYEIPRGGLQKNETPEQAAIREMKEETGLVANEVVFLGEMLPDSGLTSTHAPVYLAKVVEEGEAILEDSEAIEAIDSFTLEEIKQGFIDGYLTVDIRRTIS